jgi:hypothetical protein
METLPVSVPVPESADRQPQFRQAAKRVIVTSTKMKKAGRDIIPDTPERWIGGGKRIAMQLTLVPVSHADPGGYHPAAKTAFFGRGYFLKKDDRMPYRSANFSTTRTLSPRTVIGIGTTLS